MRGRVAEAGLAQAVANPVGWVEGDRGLAPGRPGRLLTGLAPHPPGGQRLATGDQRDARVALLDAAGGGVDQGGGPLPSQIAEQRPTRPRPDPGRHGSGGIGVLPAEQVEDIERIDRDQGGRADAGIGCRRLDGGGDQVSWFGGGAQGLGMPGDVADADDDRDGIGGGHGHGA